MQQVEDDFVDHFPIGNKREIFIWQSGIEIGVFVDKNPCIINKLFTTFVDRERN